MARPSFGDEEERLILQVLRSGWVTQGPRVVEFEQAFASRVGAAEAVAVSSGTAALFLSLHALGVGCGDEVLVPSLTFIATPNAVVLCGATPVFVDADADTYNLDPEAVAAAVTPRTRAVLAVHQLGLPADLQALAAITSRHGLHLVEDAACAVGARYRAQEIGSSGNVACFSFHPRKVLVTGEGGIITTDDSRLAARLRRLRHQGMSISDLERHTRDAVVIEEYPEVGYNFRLSDLHAALGLAQLRKLDLFLERRRAIAAAYDAALATMDDIELRRIPEYAEPNYQSYIVSLRRGNRGSRDRLLSELQRRGVASRRGLMAAHLEPCYRGARTAGSLRRTESVAARSLLLPMYADLDNSDCHYVLHHLREALDALRSEGDATLADEVGR